jgi:hypothetical protein
MHGYTICIFHTHPGSFQSDSGVFPKTARYFFTEDFHLIISSLQSNNILYNNLLATWAFHISYLLAFLQAYSSALLYYYYFVCLGGCFVDERVYTLLNYKEYT